MTDFKAGDYIRRNGDDASDVFKVTHVRIKYIGYDREGRLVVHEASVPLVRATDAEVAAFVTHKLSWLEENLERAERNVARARAEVEAERQTIQQQ
jgi:predicted metal-dependent hydrolase